MKPDPTSPCPELRSLDTEAEAVDAMKNPTCPRFNEPWRFETAREAVVYALPALAPTGTPLGLIECSSGSCRCGGFHLYR